jgi:hypothetical protein
LIALIQTPAQAQYRRHYNRGYYAPSRYYRYEPIRYASYFYHRPHVVIPYGGLSYYYSDGYYYRPYGSYFNVVIPPIGLHISVLPRGYRQFLYGPDLYYYYNGTYYRNGDNSYEVVAPPVGAEVAEIPEGAKTVVIDNRKYFEYHGTYYKETIKPNGEIWYTVTGKNGVLNSNPDVQAQTEPEQENHFEGPEIGTQVDRLPEDCKTIVINNQKYFVAPDDTYYQEQIDNNQIYYKVVGKPSDQKR